MMPETTMGMTKMVRSADFIRMRDVSPTARRKATTLTAITVTMENPKVKR